MLKCKFDLRFSICHCAETNKASDFAVGGTYQAVAFSYGSTCASGGMKNSDPGLEFPGFHPPFPVPESLVNNLPPTEKVHQIIARTATFVSEHGGQSEIVLRVKQGDNPTFGFLMPDHHLHAYFRFLVEHQELLKAETDLKPPDEEKVKSGQNQAGGALSLLGSVYGSGEDEDGALQVVSESKETDPGNSVGTVNIPFSHGSNQAESSTYLAVEDEAAIKHLSVASNKKASSPKRSPCVTAVSVGTHSKKRETETFGSIQFSVDKPQTTPMLSMSEVEEPFILEPPSSIRQAVDKIAEFILRNGREFEAVLIEQNSTNGKFKFLLPSNQYHPYYLKVLQKAQESKLPGKSLASQKHDSRSHASSKEKIREMGRSKSKDIAPSKGSAGNVANTANQSNGSHVSERKEKFKMIIGGPKKDAQDLSSKPIQRQCGMSEDATAAIVLAATRGHRHPKSDTYPKTSFDDSGTGISIGEGARTSSIGSLPLSGHVPSSISKPVSNGEPGFSMPVGLSEAVRPLDKEGGGTSNVSVAKAIAKTAALAAASEADSSEACLTREQKQKVERLKRAKMFAAMIKGGTHHSRELLPHLSIKQSDSALLDSQESSGCKAGATRPCSSQAAAAAAAALNVSGAEFPDLIAREREGSSAPVEVGGQDTMETRNDSEDDHDAERRIRKKHRSRSRRHEEDSEKDHKHSRKKHRSDHHSSHHSRDNDRKYRKSHSHHRQEHHHSSSEDEHLHGSRSSKRSRRRRHAETEREIEEGEIVEKLENHLDTSGVEDNGERDRSLDCANDLQDKSVPMVDNDRPPSSDATEVPDDLRAKIRAMLLATM
ncbi:uncharacterized protein LOC131240747 isoform X2 [Magnolia sinica]|uniref:uncharacterized protein LOC131240747 isoform X2 n=1 Tax=Magnolia sinica TaxID=86752 RepID=UPI00265AA07E|nr:uncharacterized protein LOC131240747 isoform X2 [Magnolia sinica]XP_058095170.1 uncharacterized protein LOC131240747 isoform X2 [Magnolia sinica]